jgi:hypothetical protein
MQAVLKTELISTPVSKLVTYLLSNSVKRLISTFVSYLAIQLN